VTATAVTRSRAAVKVTGRRIRWGRIGLHAFLIGIATIWLFPLVWTIYTSFRPYDDTARYGYVSFPGFDVRDGGISVSFPGEYNLGNYVEAWDRGEVPKYFINVVIILVPSVFLVLFLASMIAFAVSRFSWRFNLALLMLFTAGNLLPPQVIITPLFQLYVLLPFPWSDNGLLFYDQYWGIIAIHVAFQLGFCAFVLSNYMKTLPHELTEAALVDGASVWQIYRRVTLPLCRPPLAALATLQVTWIYNDFFWALILIKTGDKLPITSALNNLRGQFFTDNNLLAAGAIMVALPTLIVYFLLQRHFISGLTLGSTKG
jgi:multiple sugar transport system permease protein